VSAPPVRQVSDSYLGLDQRFDVDLGALARSEGNHGQTGGGQGAAAAPRHTRQAARGRAGAAAAPGAAPGAAAARGAAPEATLPAAPGVAPHVARAREASVAALRGPAAGPA